MRTKIIAALLAVLTALGGLNLFKSIKERLLPSATAQSSESYEVLDATSESHSKVRVRVKARADALSERLVKVRTNSDSKVMIDDRFSVSEGDLLYVDVAHADLEIETGTVDEAHVRVTLNSNNMEAAVQRFERMNFTVEKSGSDVRIVAESPRGNWHFDGRFDVDVFVTIPEEFNAELQTTHGDVELDDINGYVNLQTTHGAVLAGSIRGPEILLKSTHGDIEAESLESGEITVNTTHADIEIEEVTSKRFLAKTSHSDVIIERLTGESEITTSHGDIEVALIDDLGAEFRTSHGDVRVYAPSGMGADLDLEAAQVRVSSGFNVSGSVQKKHVKGSVNGGGANIKARTTHGSVELKSR